LLPLEKGADKGFRTTKRDFGMLCEGDAIMTTRKERIEQFGSGYNVTVTGRHVQISDSMKQHAIDRIHKLEHIAGRIVDVQVTMDIQKLAHRADILLKYGHTLIRSHATTPDMYISIDEAVDKLEHQLKKYKNKLQDYHRKGNPVKEIPVSVYAMVEEDFEGKHEKEEYHRVVATEVQKLRILNQGEAIMKMEFSLDPVMVFRSEDTGKLQVIYRRPDGNYGIIEPEK
jgi:putative sigma-54 modulation protein